ncbi:class I glutamine amidotransferase-like protein [Xylariales sp. AK1849]|nr:class I glutamine amidotransferase-like protein [Xylariales sp. AK1849]
MSSTAAVVEPLNIAILLNSYKSRILPAIQASYVRIIGAIAPDAKLSFFEPANKGAFPNPAFFDLIVIGGANVDARKSHSWILKIHEFLCDLVGRYPNKKILGICWGHQTVARVFGGEVVDMDIPEMGVATLTLTDEGRAFFPQAATTGEILLQQHHRREVAVPGEGFVQLAEGNHILINEKSTILTIQGHPEKDAQTARLRMHDSMRWFGYDALDEKAWAKLETQIEMEHEGGLIWDRIFEWVREPLDEFERTRRELKM